MILALLILLRVFLHYTESGFLEFLFFDMVVKWFLFFLPIGFLIYRISKKCRLWVSIADFVVTAIGFYILFFLLTPNDLDEYDWKTNYSKREKIVALAKGNKLKEVRGSGYAIPDSLSLFPFFKSNEVLIETSRDTIVTVLFYTDRGLLDHYAGFVYTNDSTDMRKFDEQVQDGGKDKKLQPNWYLVHQ